MNTGTWTLVIGGVIGGLLALFGVRLLLTGRAPSATERAFRTVRDAGLYHLLFGAGLLILVGGTRLPTPFRAISAAVAVVVAGFAVVKFRPRAKSAHPGDNGRT